MQVVPSNPEHRNQHTSHNSKDDLLVPTILDHKIDQNIYDYKNRSPYRVAFIALSI